MAGVHSLQHVECFLAAALADDDTVGSHAERILDEIALPYFAFAFHVGGACLEAANMQLLKLQFGCVLDRD
jgi:hypothetical protein